MEANINLNSYWELEKRSTPTFFKGFLSPFRRQGKILSTPKEIAEGCKGFLLNKALVKSLLFSTDMALIENNDADAVLAVYPFAPSFRIIKSLVEFSGKPVICGIGGGLTKGNEAYTVACQAEQQGAAALIVNQPFPNRDIERIKNTVQIPIISSISTIQVDVKARVNAGTDIFHVTGGGSTGSLITALREKLPHHPIMATGGRTRESLTTCIKLGANAVALTPPTPGELFRPIMDEYRKGIKFWQQVFK